MPSEKQLGSTASGLSTWPGDDNRHKLACEFAFQNRVTAGGVFAHLGVWNTELNNGVLIYLQLADRNVEIVADRGLDGRVSLPEWEAVCHLMEQHFRAGRFREGSIAGIEAVASLLARHFPADPGSRRNELPDRPVLL